MKELGIEARSSGGDHLHGPPARGCIWQAGWVLQPRRRGRSAIPKSLMNGGDAGCRSTLDLGEGLGLGLGPELF